MPNPRLTPTPDSRIIVMELSHAERNLILRLRSLRDKPRIVWLEVMPLAIVAIIEAKREQMGET